MLSEQYASIFSADGVILTPVYPHSNVCILPDLTYKLSVVCGVLNVRLPTAALGSIETDVDEDSLELESSVEEESSDESVLDESSDDSVLDESSDDSVLEESSESVLSADSELSLESSELDESADSVLSLSELVFSLEDSSLLESWLEDASSEPDESPESVAVASDEESSRRNRVTPRCVSAASVNGRQTPINSWWILMSAQESAVNNDKPTPWRLLRIGWKLKQVEYS